MPWGPGRAPARGPGPRAAPPECTRRTRNRSHRDAWRVVANRIRQPADAPDDRHGAVAHAVHLVEPARLESRRHQEDVGARLDEVRQPLVEADARADAVAVQGREPSPEVLVARLAGAEHDERRVEPRDLVRKRRDRDRSPSDRPSARSSRPADGSARAHRTARPYSLQDRDFRRPLARQVLGAVRRGKMRIASRDPTAPCRCRSGRRQDRPPGAGGCRRSRSRTPASGFPARISGSPS